MPIPTIPTMLTETDWQKSKNRVLVAKLAGETGMGALLKKVKTDYDAVNWAVFDVERVLLPTISAENAQYALQLAQAEHKRAAPLQKDLLALETLATATARKFAKNILMPKATYNHVFQIGVVAKRIHGEVDKVLVDFEAAQKKIEASKAPRRRGSWSTPTSTDEPLPGTPRKTEAKPLPVPKPKGKTVPQPPPGGEPGLTPKPTPKGKPLPPTPPQVQLMTVKEALGEQWYTDLAQITLPEHPMVLRWSIDREVANPEKTGGPLPIFVEQQALLKKALNDIDSGVDQLVALKDKRVALSQAKADEAIEQMRAAFDKIRPAPAGPGFAGPRFLDAAMDPALAKKTAQVLLPTGALNKLKARKDGEPDTPETSEWKAAHTSLIHLNQQTAEAIEQQYGLFEKLLPRLKRLRAK